MSCLRLNPQAQETRTLKRSVTGLVRSVPLGQIQLGGWVVLGTSISAPFASGIVALLMSKWGDREKIVKALKGTAKDLGYERHEQGYGLVQAYDSVRGLTCVS